MNAAHLNQFIQLAGGAVQGADGMPQLAALQNANGMAQINPADLAALQAQAAAQANQGQGENGAQQDRPDSDQDMV